MLFPKIRAGLAVRRYVEEGQPASLVVRNAPSRGLPGNDRFTRSINEELSKRGIAARATDFHHQGGSSEFEGVVIKKA